MSNVDFESPSPYEFVNGYDYVAGMYVNDPAYRVMFPERYQRYVVLYGTPILTPISPNLNDITLRGNPVVAPPRNIPPPTVRPAPSGSVPVRTPTAAVPKDGPDYGPVRTASVPRSVPASPSGPTGPSAAPRAASGRSTGMVGPTGPRGPVRPPEGLYEADARSGRWAGEGREMYRQDWQDVVDTARAVSQGAGIDGDAATFATLFNEYFGPNGLYNRDGGGGGYSGPTRQQIADAVRRMSGAAGTARQEIGNIYQQAGSSIQGLIDQYRAQQEAQNAAAGRTLQAFGVAPELARPVGGVTAEEMLRAQQAQLVAQNAAQQASLADLVSAYQTLIPAGR